jgi:hypothetical protein
MVYFKGGMEGEGGRPFSGERVGGYPFFIREKENIDILGTFVHVVSQKVPKYSKIAQNSLLANLSIFCRFGLIFYLEIIFLKC